MLKLTLLQQMLVVAIAMSSITCAFIQKTKKYISNSKYIVIYSFIINILGSLVFCITFTQINFPKSLWIGIFSFIGADTIYKTLEGQMKSYKEIIATNYIEVPKENLIKTELEDVE